jgi:uncharacterized protein (TIGR03437 family)
VLVGPGLTHSGFGDAFVAKIQPDGTGLVYCGYIGGNDGDGANSIALDNEGNAYVTGFTGSFQGFPALVGPDLSYNLNVDAFVAKVKADGTGLVYCGFIGGSSIDRGNGIKVDVAGNAYIVGDTSSNQNTFPVVVGPDLSLNVTQDVFVAKVKADGTGLTYCGYIGGRESEFGNGIAIDSAGNAYIGGWTTSSESSFPVKAGPDLTFNGSPASPDAFVAKVRFDGLGLDYCGYIGGSDFDQGFALAIDNQRNVYITGSTRSNEASFPVQSGPDLTYNGGSDDTFVAMVSESATLVYCGYIGGDRQDAGFGIATDILGNVYVTGTTSSDHMASGFPARSGPDLTYNGGGDSLIAKIGAQNPTVTSVSAASFLGGTIAVESISAAFGVGLATGIHAADSLPLPTSIAGHEVRVKDSAGVERLAPLFYLSPDQINYQVPFGTASGPALITVMTSSGSTGTGTVQIASTAPGLFAANANGQGVAAALIFRVKADGSESYDSAAQFDETLGRFVYRPIDFGPESDVVFLLLFGSGIRFRSSLSSVSVTIGGNDLQVIFAGAHPNYVGLDQITVRLSRALMGRGEVAINLIVDATTANKLWVSFH